MGAGPSMGMQDPMSGVTEGSAGAGKEADAHDLQRLRWIVRVANNPGTCEEWYEGEKMDGMRHGQGSAFYTSGDVYSGQWYKDAWHGRGALIHMSGAKYSGYFEKGEQHGSGEFVDAEGVRFRGEFRRGRKHGPGYMASPNGAQFEGWFRDGMPNGDGILTWPDGSKFVGKYVAGKEHGRGHILDPSGCRVCDVEMADGVLVGGRTVCPGSLGGGRGVKCRGGSQSCGYCLQTALDLELSITHEQPDPLQSLYWRSSRTGGSRSGSRPNSSADPGARLSRAFSGGTELMRESSVSSWGGISSTGSGQGTGAVGLGGYWNRCVVRVKARPPTARQHAVTGHSGAAGAGGMGGR